MITNEYTNSKGIEFKVGDLVTAKGSKIVRRIEQIAQATGSPVVEIYAPRVSDGPEGTAWISIEKTVKLSQ